MPERTVAPIVSLPHARSDCYGRRSNGRRTALPRPADAIEALLHDDTVAAPPRPVLPLPGAAACSSCLPPPPPSEQRQVVGMLDLLRHRVGARLAHPGQLPQHVFSKTSVVGHVRHTRLDEVVEAAGHRVAL